MITIYIEGRKTQEDAIARLHSKIAIFDTLLKQGWGTKDMISFYTFLDGFMRLPPSLEVQYQDHVIDMEMKNNRRYVTVLTRFGIVRYAFLPFKQALVLKMYAKGFTNHDIAAYLNTNEVDIARFIMEETESKAPIGEKLIAWKDWENREDWED